MRNRQATAPGPLLPELQPGEDVWAMLALPALTLLATDRRLLTERRPRRDVGLPRNYRWARQGSRVTSSSRSSTAIGRWSSTPRATRVRCRR